MADNGSRQESRAFTGLTVGDLMEVLKKHSPETPIVLTGREGGFNGARSVRAVPICYHVNSMEGFGAHDVPAPRQHHDTVALALFDTTPPPVSY